MIDWVLRKPPHEEREAIDACIARSLEALPLLLDGDMARATMALHTKPAKAPKPPKPPKPPRDARPDGAKAAEGEPRAAATRDEKPPPAED